MPDLAGSWQTEEIYCHNCIPKREAKGLLIANSPFALNSVALNQ